MTALEPIVVERKGITYPAKAGHAKLIMSEANNAVYEIPPTMRISFYGTKYNDRNNMPSERNFNDISYNTVHRIHLSMPYVYVSFTHEAYCNGVSLNRMMCSPIPFQHEDDMLYTMPLANVGGNSEVCTPLRSTSGSIYSPPTEESISNVLHDLWGGTRNKDFGTLSSATVRQLVNINRGNIFSNGYDTDNIISETRYVSFLKRWQSKGDEGYKKLLYEHKGISFKHLLAVNPSSFEDNLTVKPEALSYLTPRGNLKTVTSQEDVPKRFTNP